MIYRELGKRTQLLESSSGTPVPPPPTGENIFGNHVYIRWQHRYITHTVTRGLLWRQTQNHAFLQSLAVERAVYACPWYRHLQTMSDVKFVIMKAQKPVRLTAGKFYTVSLETYLQVVSLKAESAQICYLFEGMTWDAGAFSSEKRKGGIRGQ
jgi:hypothetical protein